MEARQCMGEKQCLGGRIGFEMVVVVSLRFVGWVLDFL